MIDGLMLPAIALGVFGWLMPRFVARLLPEGVKPLLLNAALSTILMGLVGIGFFILLYLLQGWPVAELFSAGLASAVAHFGRLSAISALMWGPMLVLSLAYLPRRWKKEVW